LDELKVRRDSLLASLDETADRIAALPSDAPDEERGVLDEIFEKDNAAVQRLTADIRRRETIMKERDSLQPQGDDDEDGAKLHARVRGSSKEPLTYEKNSLRNSGVSFYKDVILMNRGDDEARQRLNRHAQEMRVEYRDITTTAGAGGEFVPPKWLTDRWVELLRAKRPVADSLTSFPLQPGTNSINLPKLSGGGATAVQATENSGVQETDPTTTSVTAAYQTIAGQIDLSRQLYEFSNPSMDEILTRDLAADFATKLDVAVISGNVTNAKGLRNVSGINTVTYTQATPTVSTLWPKVTDAIQRITSAFLNPDTIAMHPRRAGQLLAGVDSTGRPLFNAGAPQNSMGDVSGTVANGFAGGLQGMNVVIDPNLPTTLGAGTNEDIILVYASDEIFLFEEGAPRTRVFEDVGSGTLTVRLSCYGFYGIMAGRYPGAISLITGTGLVPPSF